MCLVPSVCVCTSRVRILCACACALTEPRSSPNLTLNLQTLLEFHVEECNFDFNKWIYAGIPYTGTLWGETEEEEGGGR